MSSSQSFNVHLSKGVSHTTGVWYRHKDAYLDLYPGKQPYMRKVADIEDHQIETEMSLEAVHDNSGSCRPHMNDATQFYMHSDYPAYLVLDNSHTQPRLMTMSVMAWKRLNDNIARKKKTWEQEKLLAHLNIRYVESNAGGSQEQGYNVAIYFKDGINNVYYIHVDESTLNLTTQKEYGDSEWRKHVQFTQFQTPPCSYLHTLPKHCTSRT